MNEEYSKLHSICQKLYFAFGILYVLVLPLIVMFLCQKEESMNLLMIWHNLALTISICVFLVFLIENLIDKKNIKKLKNNKLELIFFSLFYIWIIISTFFSIDIELSISGNGFRHTGLIQMFSFIGFAMLGISLNKKNRIKLLHLICYVSFIMAFINLTNEELSNIVFPSFHNYSTIFYHFNHYAYYLVYCIIISIFLYLYDKGILMKIINFIIYLTLIWILIVNNTFGCYLSILFTLFFLLVYCIKKHKICSYIIILIPFIILSMTLKVDNKIVVYENFKDLKQDINLIIQNISTKYDDVTDDPVSENELYIEEHYEIAEDNSIDSIGTYRGSLWKHAIEFIKMRPLVGYGLETIGQVYEPVIGYPDIPHNLILNLCTFIGIPGMLFYLLGVIVIIVKNFKKKNKDYIDNLTFFVIIGHLISSMFGNTMYYTTPYYIIILGMSMIELNKEDNIN